ncbi:MAG: aminotransferase class III-fold pyridoxal phosphate-dependent enzyme, partial [Chloroflexi bacterium]|nr:aminotransferase class III-fold pyridoxal phosphate-dependent enzyme [Chloroflexota bacterium]
MGTPRATGRPSSAQDVFAAAQEHLPGGVSAAARIHGSLGRPFLTSRGQGGWVFDLDGTGYVDLNTSNGAALLGHGHPAVRRAVEQALDLGLICAHETPFQAEVARKLSAMVPSVELVRFTTSGTETTWYAIRTARLYTGKSVVVKFEGHFHGYHDYLGYSAWPPLEVAPGSVVPESGGIPPELQEFVIVLPWNDADALRRTLETRG